MAQCVAPLVTVDRSLSLLTDVDCLFDPSGTSVFEEIVVIIGVMHVGCSQRESLDSANDGGWTALMYASYIGHDLVVQQLLEAGVSVNSANNKGQSPLTLATSCGNDKTAELLIKVSMHSVVLDCVFVIK